MKKIFWTLFIILPACNQKIGDKLQSMIEAHLKDGLNIEHLKIDSFRYSLGTLQEYYSMRSDQITDYIKEQKKILSDARDIHDYSLISELSHAIMRDISKNEFLLKLITNTPEEPKVYTINYFIDYQTDKSNYQGHQTDFLFAKDLSHVNISVDSLYNISASPIPVKYDSVSDMNVLKDNDSLSSLAHSLSNKLELKIAGGTSQLQVLEDEKRILEIKKMVIDNEAKYPYLYMY